MLYSSSTFLLALCLFLAGCGNSSKRNDPKTDAQVLGLNGRIKMFRETYNKAVNLSGTISKGDLAGISMETHFSTTGKQIKSIWQSPNFGKSETFFGYDDKDNLTKIESYTEKHIDRNLTYRYNNKGTAIEDKEISYNPDGSIESKTLRKYNERGSLIESTSYKANDIMDRKWIYRYDGNGKEVEKTRYETAGKIYSKQTNSYEYGALNNWIKQITYTATNPTASSKPEIVAVRTIEYY